MRNLDDKPYSEDGARVAKFLFERGVGGGDDPIESLLASYELLSAERKEWKQAAEVEAGLRREFLTRALAAEDMVDLLEKNAGIQAKLLADTGREVGRLRAIVRINLMRSCGATHDEIDDILNSPGE